MSITSLIFRGLTRHHQVRAVSIEDKNSAVETVSREKSTSDPGSVGAPMSGVVVEVRVKDGQEIKKGDPVCGE
jgi:pyruvate carboxylase